MENKRRAANTLMFRVGSKNGGIKLKLNFTTVMIFALFMSIGFVVGMSKFDLFKKKKQCCCDCCEED